MGVAVDAGKGSAVGTGDGVDVGVGVSAGSDVGIGVAAAVTVSVGVGTAGVNEGAGGNCPPVGPAVDSGAAVEKIGAAVAGS